MQELVDTGAIAPKDAANHPIAHMLTRSLGPAEATQPEVNILPEPARPGDKFLLCSDGLYNHVSNEEIAEVLSTRSPKEAVEILVQMALDGGGSDNVTIQVIETLSIADETVPVTRPADGSAEKFISSEIDVQRFSGVTLSDFTRSVIPHEEDQAEDGVEDEEAFKLHLSRKSQSMGRASKVLILRPRLQTSCLLRKLKNTKSIRKRATWLPHTRVSTKQLHTSLRY